MPETARCIYCLEEKPLSMFNTEHVISRMLGRYNNAPTLSHYEVCQECNTYFCNEIENKLSTDSLEGLLRLRFHHAKAKDTGRIIGKTRLSVTGQNGVFDGLQFTPSMNGSNPEGIQLIAEPVIGIRLTTTDNEYKYYTIEDLPLASELLQAQETLKGTQIIVIGYDKEEAERVLLGKGYNLTQATYTDNISFSDLCESDSVEVAIKAKVDPLLHRLSLKNIVNYACYTLGKEYVLRPSLTNLRNYARYGTVGETLRSNICEKGLVGIQDNSPNSHIVGIGITAFPDGFYTMGFVSWFGAITYSFILEKADVLSLNTDDLKCIVCDNNTGQIIELPNFVVIDWPKSGCHIQVEGNNLLIIPTN